MALAIQTGKLVYKVDEDVRGKNLRMEPVEPMEPCG